MSQNQNQPHSFKLKSFEEIFGPKDKPAVPSDNKVQHLPAEKLVPFKNHPFKLYEGERFRDMVESIKANGIIVPVIVRALDGGETYEILSGHNRTEAAKAAGLGNVPVIIRENVSDDDALFIVMETNLIQRSFADLSHSERAGTLTVHYEAIKQQGKRTDLITEIENLLKITDNPSNHAEFGTNAPMAHRSNSRDKIAQQYGLSKDTVARYLRVYKLIPELKQRVDSNEIPIRAAVDLSYLPDNLQAEVHSFMERFHYTVDIRKAELLREYSEAGRLISEAMDDILSGTVLVKKPSDNNRAVKINRKILDKYFAPEQSPKEIQAEIIEALEFFRENNQSVKKGGFNPE